MRVPRIPSLSVAGDARRWLHPASILVLGLLATFGIWRMLLAFEERVVETRFGALVEERDLLIRKQFDAALGSLDDLCALYEVVGDVSVAQFQSFSRSILERHRALKALGWNPLVLSSAREDYELAAHEDFPGYQISERDPEGALAPAGVRSAYFPVRIIEPYPGNEAALGFDIRSESIRRAAIQHALETGELAVTGRIQLVQESRDEAAVLALKPVYRDETQPPSGETQERTSDGLRGFVVGVFQVGTIIEGALAPVGARGVGIHLHDAGDLDDEVELYTNQVEDAGHGENPLSRSVSMDWGGRHWRIDYWPTQVFLDRQKTAAPAIALLVGLFVTGLLAAGGSALARRTAHLEEEIATRKRLEAKIIETQKLESLGVLAGGIAHDFNNLLVGLLGSADYALESLDPEDDVRAELEQIRLVSVRASELTRQLLAYAGKSDLILEPLDLSQIVEEMLHLLESSISKKASLQFDRGRERAIVNGDATQIRQVVMNLITNASDSLGEASGVISLRTGVRDVGAEELASAFPPQDRGPGRFALIEITDTGCGMDRDTIHKIFDPFFTTKFQGRGLGLASVLGIARSHDGAVTVESEPLRGTTIRVLLPQADAVQDVSRDEPRHHDSAREGSGTVLVIDDEPAVRRLVARILTHAGFRVVVAEDGHQGAEIYRRRADEIDAVLLDFTMPTMNGRETLAALRMIRPNVRVVFTSGYAESESAGELLGEGVFGFIAKPFRSAELIGKVAFAIGERKSDA